MIIRDDFADEQRPHLTDGPGPSKGDKKYWFKLLIQALLIMPYPSNEDFFLPTWHPIVYD